MIEKKNPRVVGGPDGITFEEHIQQVERYLDYQGPQNLLRHELEARVSKDGINCLSEPERVFYLVDAFIAAMMCGEFPDYAAQADLRLIRATRLALSALHYDELADACETVFLCAIGHAWEETPAGELFIGYCLDVDLALDIYAEDQGLYVD